MEFSKVLTNNLHPTGNKMLENSTNINWHGIWEKKGTSADVNNSLIQLINLNGFDTGCGSYNEDQWLALADDFIARTELCQHDKILELGCGSGAFLYALNHHVPASYFGIDYSEPLIRVAKKVLQEASLCCSEADKSAFGVENFDIIFSHSVFQYFSSLNYAYKVLFLWTRRLSSGGKLVLMDLNDIAFKKNYHALRKKDADISSCYDSKYKSLKHLFFNKNELKNVLLSLGMKDVEFFPHSEKKYGNAKYRFNVMCRKTN